MVIDSSLAKGLNKREHRRLQHAFDTVKTLDCKGTRAAWLRRVNRHITSLFGEYICLVDTTGTKPANTEIIYLVINPAEYEEYVAFVVTLIGVIGRDQKVDTADFPIGITHHAFERVIQSVGTENVKSAVKILHDPIQSMFSIMNKKIERDGNFFTKDKEFRIYSDFGIFIFRTDEDKWCLLRTVIKADALEGRNRRNWEKEVHKAKTFS